MRRQLQPEGYFPAAGLIRRLAAMFYDFLLCLALVMVLTLLYQQGLLRLIHGPEQLLALSEAGTLDRDPWLASMLLLSLFGYLGWMWAFKGQTLGMQAWRLRLEDEQGRAITLNQALIRFLVAPLGLLCGGLGMLWILWDPYSRSWQDIASGSRIVRLPKP